LRTDIEDDDVAVFDFAGELIVVQRSGIGAGADDGGVALRLRASHGVDFHHFGGDLIFMEAGAHHAHGRELRIHRKLDSLSKESNFARRFDLAQTRAACPWVTRLVWRSVLL